MSSGGGSRWSAIREVVRVEKERLEKKCDRGESIERESREGVRVNYERVEKECE